MNVEQREKLRELAPFGIDELTHEHWLVFDKGDMAEGITGCHCGFRADTEEDAGYGDSVVRHLFSVALGEHAALLDRLEAAEAAVERVRGLTTDTDGNEWEHEHDECEGYPDCPACWALDVRHAIAPRLSASGATETKDGDRLARVREAVAALEPHTADTTDTARGVAFARDIIRLALEDVPPEDGVGA